MTGNLWSNRTWNLVFLVGLGIALCLTIGVAKEKGSRRNVDDVAGGGVADTSGNPPSVRPDRAHVVHRERSLQDRFDELGDPAANGVPAWGDSRSRCDADFIYDDLCTGETMDRSAPARHAPNDSSTESCILVGRSTSVFSQGGTTMAEEQIGVVTHYFGKIGVAAIEITSGELAVGDAIHIKGHTSDFSQTVESMQIENKSVEIARAGETIGLKVVEHAREHDVVFKVTAD